jgi:hypothetical protein
MKSEVYFTLRHFMFPHSSPVNAPQVCIVINPHSKLKHCCFPILDLGKNCDELFPNCTEIMYESFLEFDIHEKTRYRPNTIMVDDPLLAVFLGRELHGSGTVVKLVYLEQEVIQTILSEEDTTLSQICNNLFPEIRQATVQYVRENADTMEWKCRIDEKTARAAAAAEEVEHGDLLILRACSWCGVLAPRIKRCGGCLDHLQTNYCSSKCQLAGWRQHKEVCTNKVWTLASLV